MANFMSVAYVHNRCWYNFKYSCMTCERQLPPRSNLLPLGKLLHNEASNTHCCHLANQAASSFYFCRQHLNNFMTACQSKGQQVNFHYWSCDLIEHNKALDWLRVFSKILRHLAQAGSQCNSYRRVSRSEFSMQKLRLLNQLMMY